MSKVQVSGNALGSGTVTLAAPNTNSDYTLSLPAATGTLDTLQRAGNVLQVVQSVLTTAFTTTSGTRIATGLAASITPSKTTSKILVFVQGNANATAAAGSNCYVDTGLFKNGNLLATEFAQVGSFGSTDFRGVLTICYLDSPNTTSSTAYQLYIGSAFASAVWLNNGAGTSTITLLEIAA